MKRLLIYLLFGVPLISVGLAAQDFNFYCPSPNTIHPCYCDTKIPVTVVCENITYDEVLKAAVTAVKKNAVYGIELKSVFVRYLPENLFEGTYIQSLAISNSSLLSLSDGEYAFKGLEDRLTVFKVKNCTYASHWEWTQLERLKNLQVLEISQSNMLEIADDFLDLTSKWPLTNINFRENNIKHMPPKAFSRFKFLKQLYLDKNSLKSVERSLLPKPAEYLNSIGFGENEIRELPADMFSEMPSLTYLYLGGNPIMVLDAQTFQPVWDQLKIVILSDILHCDCRMSWMPRMGTKFRSVKATCNTPAKLRGRNPADLKTADLEC